MATIKGIKAGTTTITASYGGKTTSQSFTVNRITPSLNFSPSSTTLTYNGSAQTLGTVSYGGDGTVEYSFDNSTWVSLSLTSGSATISATNAGTYNVYLRSSQGTNYLAVSAFYSDQKIINKATPTFTKSNGTQKYPATASGTVTASVPGKAYYGTSTSSMSSTLNLSANTAGTIVSRTSSSNIGTTTVYAYFVPSDTTNYNNVGSSSSGYLTITATTTIGDGSGSVEMTGWTYGGTVTNPSPSSSTNGTGSVSYTWYNSSKTALSAKPTSTSTVGTYYVKATFAATTNYTAYTTDYVSFTISQRTVSITAPSYNSSTLTYDGNSKTIASNGSCSDGGTFYYYISTSSTKPTFSTSTWSTSAPTATDAGTYYVWYYAYVSDTTNNTGTGINTVTAISGSKSIGKASITPTVSMSDYIYAGTKSTPSISGNSGSGTVTYYYNTSDSNSGGTAWSNVTSSTSLNAGKYYMYAVVAATSNYNGATSATTPFTISKATPTLSITLATGLVYNLNNQSLVTAASVTGGGAIYTGVGSSSSSAPSSWSTWTTSCTGKDAKTYYVWAKSDASTNYNAVSATYKGTVTIATKTATVTSYPSTKDTVYSGSSITLINGGSATGATFTYSTSENGTYSTTIPSGTNVSDSKTIYWKLTANTNYNTTGLTTSGNCPGNITQMSISIPTPTNGSGTYNGTTGYKATFGSCTGASITSYRYSTDNSTWTTSSGNPTWTNAGTYYAQAYYTASDNYTGSGWSSSATISVAKADSTLPTTWQGASVAYHNTASLTYSGQAGGTIKFRYDANNGTSWTEIDSAPTRTTLGNTAVQCMIVGDSNHNNSSWSSTVTLTVYQATDARMTVTLSGELTYNKKSQTLATASDLHGISTYYLGYSTSSDDATDANVTWGSANTTTISATTAGTYYIYYKFSPDSTHSNTVDCTYVGSVVIKRATGTITYSASSPSDFYCTTEPTVATTLVAAKTVTISTGATNATGTISYSIDLTGWTTTGLEITIPKGTASGTYYPTITAKSAQSTNYNEATKAQQITVTILSQELDHIVMTLADSVNYLSTVTPTTTAYYSSGASTTVSADYTANPTGIVEIS